MSECRGSAPSKLPVAPRPPACRAGGSTKLHLEAFEDRARSHGMATGDGGADFRRVRRPDDVSAYQPQASVEPPHGLRTFLNILSTPAFHRSPGTSAIHPEKAVRYGPALCSPAKASFRPKY